MLYRMFGFLNIYKPSGPTSHDMVDAVRRRIGKGIKVGHAGTLDPFAQGVLVICVGSAARLSDYIQDSPKGYKATIRLGGTSTTDDPKGKVTPTEGAKAVAEEDVLRAVESFSGQIDQRPPNYSAVYVSGRRAYKLARKGHELNLAARPIVIHSIKLLRYAYPDLEIELSCSSGTYIRSLARDIGTALGVGGYCAELTRTFVGCFDISQAVTCDKLDPDRDLMSPLLAVQDLPRVVLDAAHAQRILLGQRVPMNTSQVPQSPDQEIAVVDESGKLLAIGTIEHGTVLRPLKVIHES